MAAQSGSSADSTTEAEHRNPWPIRAAVIGAIATLLASVGGLYFSAQTSRQATEQASQAQEAQASERFSRSVEQLGSDSIAVRIGAVYSFARLMRDSAADQQAITEILSTFVRLQGDAVPPPEGQELRTVPVDLLAAIKVLDAFGANAAQSDPLTTMLLRKVNLSKFDLRSVSMRGADLSLADLSGTDLHSASLTNADLDRANLGGANLLAAHLQRADLTLADLSGAILSGADLQGAELSGADLRNANLNSAHLTGADLSTAHLNSATLNSADLRNASLTGADLTNADLTNADLTNADLAYVTCSPTTKWPADFGSTPDCN